MATGTASNVNREWIATEFSKGIEAERRLHEDAVSTSASPPDPELGVLYHEIAAADDRHRQAIETIATRYGYNPGHSGGMLAGTLGKISQKVGEIGATPWSRIAHDLTSKSDAIHWMTAWVETFQGIGDIESARELAGLLAEERSHHTALQAGLNRLVLKCATAHEGNA